MSKEQNLKIIEFRAENVKRLKVVNIKPDGNLIVIGGKNEQGKSSVLDSIMMALGGKRAVPAKPIRDGEKFAEVFLDLGDFKVTRRMYSDGESTITVEGSEGFKLSSPQAILDALVGSISFDPLAFYHMENAKQVKTLQEVAGIDLSELLDKRESIFNTRTVRNRDLNAAKASLQKAVNPDDAPDAEIDLDPINERISKANAYDDSLNALQSRMSDGQTAISNLKDEIKAKQEKLAGYETFMVGLNNDLKAFKKDVPDMEALANERTKAREANKRFAQHKNYLYEKGEVDRLTAETDGYTKELSEIDAEKAKIIASADFPVDGLSLDPDGITLNGIPFKQCSDAQALKVSVGLALAMNAKLKVLLIRNGNTLDEDNLKVVASMAAKAGAQVWMERVGVDEATSVILSDGMVQE